MKPFLIDFTNVLKDNKSALKFSLSSGKGPVKRNYCKVTRNGKRLNYAFEKKANMSIAGKDIKDVKRYSVMKYKDSNTQNGKFYEISTPVSDISLYTYDDKFAHMSIDSSCGGKLKFETIYRDGSQKIELRDAYNSSQFTYIAPDGSVIQPKKSGFQQILSKIKNGLKCF